MVTVLLCFGYSDVCCFNCSGMLWCLLSLFVWWFCWILLLSVFRFVGFDVVGAMRLLGFSGFVDLVRWLLLLAGVGYYGLMRSVLAF